MFKTNNQKILALAGLLIVILSVYSAINYQFNNFYEFLLLGLFFSLKPFTGKISRSTYFVLYLIFFAAGIISDLVMGIYLTGLWHYTYNHFWEYLILYLVIYPMAGLVMVQSYLVIKNRCLKLSNKGGKKPLLSLKRIKQIILIMIGLLAVDILDVLIRRTKINLVLFFVISSLIAFLILSYISQAYNHNTVIEDIHRHPLKSLILLIAATCLNAVLHEIPNTFAHQWVYSNWPLENIRLASIPLVVLLLWPLLLIIPVASYYLVLPSRKHRVN